MRQGRAKNAAPERSMVYGLLILSARVGKQVSRVKIAGIREGDWGGGTRETCRSVTRPPPMGDVMILLIKTSEKRLLGKSEQ